jgi:hypothetical protein
MIILSLPPPIGYVHLYHAVDVIGRTLRGTDWVPVRCQDELKYQVDKNLTTVDAVILSIAEACEVGKLAAAFQDAFKGADDLDRSVWRKLHWRSYFATGKIIVDLPYIPPHPDGKLTPCERKIFIRKDSLVKFAENIATEEPRLGLAPGHYGSDGPLLEEMSRLIASGMTLTKASSQLAVRADGGGLPDSQARRLRAKFKALQEV